MPRSTISKPTSLRGTPGAFCAASASRPRKSPLPMLHDPAEVGLEGRDRVVDVVAVERHLRLESQRVARAEPARRDAVDLSLLEQPPEDGLRVFGTAVDLEPVLARVAGAGDERRKPATFAVEKTVVRQARRIGLATTRPSSAAASVPGRRSGRSRSLWSSTRTSPCRRSVRPREVLGGIAGVDDEQILVGRLAVDEKIVDEGPLLRQERGVVDASVRQLRDVVGRQGLEPRQSARAGDVGTRPCAKRRRVRRARAPPGAPRGSRRTAPASPSRRNRSAPRGELAVQVVERRPLECGGRSRGGGHAEEEISTRGGGSRCAGRRRSRRRPSGGRCRDFWRAALSRPGRRARDSSGRARRRERARRRRAAARPAGLTAEADMLFRLAETLDAAGPRRGGRLARPRAPRGGTRRPGAALRARRQRSGAGRPAAPGGPRLRVGAAPARRGAAPRPVRSPHRLGARPAGISREALRRSRPGPARGGAAAPGRPAGGDDRPVPRAARALAPGEVPSWPDAVAAARDRLMEEAERRAPSVSWPDHSADLLRVPRPAPGRVLGGHAGSRAPPRRDAGAPGSRRGRALPRPRPPASCADSPPEALSTEAASPPARSPSSCRAARARAAHARRRPAHGRGPGREISSAKRPCSERRADVRRPGAGAVTLLGLHSRLLRLRPGPRRLAALPADAPRPPARPPERSFPKILSRGQPPSRAPRAHRRRRGGAPTRSRSRTGPAR